MESNPHGKPTELNNLLQTSSLWQDKMAGCPRSMHWSKTYYQCAGMSPLNAKPATVLQTVVGVRREKAMGYRV
ncbi:hypothetical protein PM082_018813 [Marasmius tenuissimus]|nr:hypothetical protein PM082_018813 [Marasmius tenuissimus]